MERRISDCAPISFTAGFRLSSSAGPVASVTGLIAFPYVRRATTGIVALIERA
jgi:hypothetical protein